jgi:hypothetical protein
MDYGKSEVYRTGSQHLLVTPGFIELRLTLTIILAGICRTAENLTTRFIFGEWSFTLTFLL